MSRRILFYVQHLLGVGHVFRAMRIARALSQAGFAVDLVQGGEPVEGLDAGGARLHQLPPLKAGSVTFSALETPEGIVADAAYLAARRDRLLAIFAETRPDVVITEAFPFGRRQMRFELMPLLEAAHARPDRPAVIASVRDILQESRKPGRDAETVETILGLYDHVLVHADPALVRLEATFPMAGAIADRLLYTGIVAPEAAAVAETQPGEAFDVVVSVGGGVYGRDLLFAAAGARALSTLADGRWLIVTGPNTAEADVARLNALACDGGGLTITPFLPDLRAAIARAKVSVSRAGYNTVADVYRAGCRAVIVPLGDGEETEQITRAALLAEAGLAETVDAHGQTAEAVAAAIDRALARPVPDRSRIDLEGAAKTAAIVSAILSGADLAAYR